jgi:hypothetical protein
VPDLGRPNLDNLDVCREAVFLAAKKTDEIDDY